MQFVYIQGKYVERLFIFGHQKNIWIIFKVSKLVIYDPQYFIPKFLQKSLFGNQQQSYP